MSVNGVSTATNYGIQGQTQNKKMSPVQKGALIGGGVALAGTAFNVANGTYKTIGFNKLQTAGVVIAGIALDALIGAGIGKLVEKSQEKKAQKQASLDKQA